MNPKTLSALATLVLLASGERARNRVRTRARLTFGLRSFHFTANPTEGALITTGPFRYVRNSIYAAVLLFMWTGVATNLTLASALLGLLVLAMLLVRIFCEEGELRNSHRHTPSDSD